MKREIAVLTAFIGIFLAGSHHIRASQQEQSKVTIVPGVGMGGYTLDMSKDDVLRRLGKPKNIHFGGEDYTLDNLPKRYFMFYDDISFSIDEEEVKGISTHSPRYKFTNGLKVGDSQDRIIQAFGRDFQLDELKTMNCLTYDNKGLYFEIDKENGRIEEISVSTISSHGHESSSVEPFDDVRAKDLSKFDLSARKGLITKLQFNRETIWPERAKMPPGSNPEKILTEAMNPGLGVRKLHQKGITGKDINVAIIDQPLFKDHPEYDGKIVAYYDTGCNGSESSMHGPAVASLLVGTNCGTAPDARVYYAAAPSWKADSAYYAKGLEWIIAQNEKLPETDKIRVVSVSAAPSGPGSPFKKNREMWDQACARAEADGIMVLDCTNSPRGFISRGWYDPDDPESVPKCNYGPPPKREYRVDPTEKSLYVPSSCRTTAQHYDYHGRNSYIYWGRGGLSWAIPYCTGVLAMGWQIRPDLTPEQMNQMLFASAYVHESGAKIIHPAAFIALVRKQGDNQNVQSSGMISLPKIDRKPKPEMAEPREMKSLPKYDPDSDNPFQIDLRCRDLSKLDLSHSIDELLYATFDDRTVWPASDKMPRDFTWQKIMEQGKNPGLSVRRLHEKGITGRGVRVAILDQPLLVDHQEYVERVRLYEEIDLQGRTDPAMHGAAVASIAVGKTVGVAPEAELYYIAKYNFDRKGTVTMRYIARGINRILEVNERLPKNNKIRVISISRGWGPSNNGYDDVTEACEKAKAAGIFVVSCSLERVYGFQFHGLGRQPLANPDVLESYEPGLWWAKSFYDSAPMRSSDRLLIPMDSRTTASPCGSDKYVFYRQGGWSWSVPYIAGVYALAAQVEPDITPERFWGLAMKTGRIIELEHKGEKRPFGPIIDPVKLISSISEDAVASQRAPSKHIIVPGVRIGDYILDMTKDEVLKELGEPEAINSILLEGDEVIRLGEKCGLNNLPEQYIFSFRDVSLWMDDDSIELINVRSPLYKLSGGLGVGDSEQKIKQVFGEDFKLEEALGKEFHCYHAKGFGFHIHKKNQTVAEIIVYRAEGSHGDPDVPDSTEEALIRKAAAEGRIAYKLTTPDEFKAIAGKPIREWMEADDEVINLKYPGIQARFFGKPDIQTPYTLMSISCEGRRVDIGRNRPIVLRHVGDLDKFGSFWGYCNVDLSRLDLSQQREIVKTTTFDSLTVWPPPDRLPPGFDPAERLEWGKNPGLGVRSLHQEGITGKGVGIAIIDQPLLKDHVEYADRIKSYHAIEVEGVDIQMHGPPVCSIAVGRNCGVAPEASLHYYAVPPWKWLENRPWARTVEQIVERNRDLPPSEKVRVISISLGAFWQRDYLEKWQSAVERANRNGILVVTCDPLFLRYVTLERLVGKDPDDPNNYCFDSGADALYVPASNRSMASHRGKDVYTFDTRGGNSWTVPYLAGLAAMAFQIHPEISPERIVTLFQETATRTKQGRVINPRGFVEAVKHIKAQRL